MSGGSGSQSLRPSTGSRGPGFEKRHLGLAVSEGSSLPWSGSGSCWVLTLAFGGALSLNCGRRGNRFLPLGAEGCGEGREGGGLGAALVDLEEWPGLVSRSVTGCVRPLAAGSGFCPRACRCPDQPPAARCLCPTRRQSLGLRCLRARLRPGHPAAQGEPGSHAVPVVEAPSSAGSPLSARS